MEEKMKKKRFFPGEVSWALPPVSHGWGSDKNRA